MKVIEMYKIMNSLYQWWYNLPSIFQECRERIEEYRPDEIIVKDLYIALVVNHIISGKVWQGGAVYDVHYADISVTGRKIFWWTPRKVTLKNFSFREDVLYRKMKGDSLTTEMTEAWNIDMKKHTARLENEIGINIRGSDKRFSLDMRTVNFGSF